MSPKFPDSPDSQTNGEKIPVHNEPLKTRRKMTFLSLVQAGVVEER